MSDSELFLSLLRISAAQALRSAGLTSAKPSVLDAFTDILARYLILLGTTTSEFAASAGRIHAELDDVRLALEHVSLMLPLNVFNDPNDDDTRGIDSLIEWFRGPQASQMRRVAGYAGATIAGAQPAEVETGVKNEEWLTALKKLTNKRGKQETICSSTIQHVPGSY